MIEKMISVVIPVHNSASVLRECLSNLFKNTYSNFEVIVVDDCSRDNSVGIARCYPCTVIKLPEQRGPAFARDKGAARARGEVVAFLDSDCIVPTDWLAKINEKLTSQVVGIGGKYTSPQKANEIFSLFMNYWDLKNVAYKKPIDLISLSGGNSAFWKDALVKKRKKKELAYCNTRVGGDDTILCAELAKFGRIQYDPDLTVLHKKKSSLSKIVRETVDLGYSGAAVAMVCGALLLKEPHRFYKSLLYILSLMLLFSLILLPVTKMPLISAYLFIAYISALVPVARRVVGCLPNRRYIVFLPAVILMSDIFFCMGHLKMAASAVKRVVGSILWKAQLALSLLNPSSLYRVFFFVTKKCNASCYFCFNGEYEEKREEDLSLEEIRVIAGKAGFLPWLTITGGEPFLRNDIYEICRAFYSSSRTRIISIATNGIFTERIEDTVERLLLTCSRLYLTVIVAVDDKDQMHDALKGVEGAHKKALHTLERLRLLQSRFPRLTLGVNTTILKENAGRIEEILAYLRNNIEYDRQCLNLLRQKPCTTNENEIISIRAYLDLMKTVTFPKRGSRGFFGSLKERFNRAALEYFCDRAFKEFTQKKALGTCLAGRKFLVIDNNGSVYPCELLREELASLRNEKYDLKRVLRGASAYTMRSRIKKTGCYCQWACAVASNGYFKILSYPRIIGRFLHPRKKRYDNVERTAV